MNKHTSEKWIKAAKRLAPAIVFSFLLLFAFAADTSECTAAEESASFFIECGEGHEATAQKLESCFNNPGFNYPNVSATRNGTKRASMEIDDRTGSSRKA